MTETKCKATGKVDARNPQEFIVVKADHNHEEDHEIQAAAKVKELKLRNDAGESFAARYDIYNDALAK